MGEVSVMDINPRTTVTICTAPSRMDLHPAVGSNDPWMLRSVSPRPHCHEEFVLGGEPSGAGQADSGAADAHAHARSRCKCVDIETNRYQLGLAAGVRASWKKFLKIVLAYCMGYDKRKETNLTKEKIKWALIYIV